MALVAMAEEYLQIPVGQIAPSGHNPRRTFEEDGLAELADSLRTVGVIEPLIVRRIAEDQYTLVAGERRWRAAQIAGLADVPVVVRDYNDRQAREVQLVENLQRKGVDAIQEAEGFRELMDQFGYTADQIAERLGKKPRVIYQRLALIKLPESVKEAVAARKITANHAILIARLGNPQHQAQVLEYATNDRRGDVSVRDLDQMIKRQILLKLDAAPFERRDGELLAAAGSCEDCPKRSGNARELFAELRSPNICTDRDCYERKVKAHINREIKSAGPNGLLQVVRGHHSFWPEKKPAHVYDTEAYTLVEKKSQRCAHVGDGIVVFGNGVGERVQICIHPKCEKHAKSRSSSGGCQRSDAEKAKARAEKLKVDTARAVRNRVVSAIVEQAPAEITLSVIEAAVERWWQDIGGDARRLIRKRHPEWDADIIPIGDLDEAGLVRLIVEMTNWGNLFVMSWGNHDNVPEDLQAAATVAKVDWEAIEKATVAELAAPKVKGGKKGALMEAFNGIESDNGVEIQLRAKAKGPVLAEIVLVSGSVGRPRLVEKFAGEEPELGWAANITVKLAGEEARKVKVLDDDDGPFESTKPALVAAFTRIGELSVGIGNDARMVRDWSERRLAVLGVLSTPKAVA